MLLHKTRKGCKTANMIIFSASISACERGGQWEQALTLLHKMRENSMMSDVITCSVVTTQPQAVTTRRLAVTTWR